MGAEKTVTRMQDNSNLVCYPAALASHEQD